MDFSIQIHDLKSQYRKQIKTGKNLAGPDLNITAPPLTSKVLQLLAEQDQTPAVGVITRHVREILDSHEREAEQNLTLCTSLLRDMVGAYAKLFPDASPQQLEARLLGVRLTQRPDRAQLEQLRQHIIALAQAAGGLASAAAPGAAKPEPASSTERADIAEQPARETAPQTEALEIHPEAAAQQPTESGEDRRLDTDQHRLIDEKRTRVQKVQETLAHQVREVIKQNERFGAILSSEHENLLRSGDDADLRQLKQSLITEVATLREGHGALTKKLEMANNYLRIIETEGQYLNDELTRVHILSLTDELTELPNRRAFVRRLEDEVARVQRYGYPLSLALIDMDGFKSVNDKYGHAAGDEVLRNFSTNILAIFRHHDMVARYGGEEFAVLLPNTDKAGALRALEKVKKRTAESSYQHEGRAMPMPTFSAGISLYKPGETPGSLIDRADKALYQAKRTGRNRIELAQHDGGAEPAPR
ncbi:MAG: GGDEF domain-containing protein [Gammaproteobacteria bacterium]|nr:GGDEF domain-containing protein [Gammaproteobacteria bacterium]